MPVARPRIGLARRIAHDPARSGYRTFNRRRGIRFLSDFPRAVAWATANGMGFTSHAQGCAMKSKQCIHDVKSDPATILQHIFQEWTQWWLIG